MTQIEVETPLYITFSGTPESDETGAWLTDLRVVEVSCLGHLIPFSTLPEEVQTAILKLAGDAEWPTPSTDDFGDDE